MVWAFKMPRGAAQGLRTSRVVIPFSRTGSLIQGGIGVPAGPFEVSNLAHLLGRQRKCKDGRDARRTLHQGCFEVIRIGS